MVTRPNSDSKEALENNLADLILGGDDDGDDQDNDQDNDQDDQQDDNQDDNQDDQRRQQDDGDQDDQDDPIARAARGGRDRQQDNQRSNKPGKKPDPFDPRLKISIDKKGNLVAEDGQIVARAGFERRVVERARTVVHQERQAAGQLAAKMAKIGPAIKELVTKYKTLENNKSLFEKGGIDFATQQTMLEIATQWKKSPLEGVKTFLTKAAAAGVDLKQLGAGGGIDVQSLMAEFDKRLDEKFKPVQEFTAKSENQNKIAQDAQGFFTRNPEARDVAMAIGPDIFLRTLGEMVVREPDKDLDEHWKVLHYEILRRGGVRPNRQRRRQRQLPSGGDRENRPRRRSLERGENRFNGTESFDDIGASVLRDLKVAQN